MTTIQELASRRYPDETPRMALHFFNSDRKHAGLGPLANRRTTGPVVREKWLTESGFVAYKLSTHREERRTIGGSGPRAPGP